MSVRRAACLLALAVLTAAARPLTQPTRDVEVVYTLTRGSQHAQERSRWQASTGRQRVDPPGGGYMLSDIRAGTVAMVDDKARRIIELKTPPGPLNGGGAAFGRLGTRSIAGVACTEWSVTPQGETKGGPTQICLTDDGVLLGIRAGDVQRAIAERVTYAPADPSAFELPPDYTRTSPLPPASPPR